MQMKTALIILSLFIVSVCNAETSCEKYNTMSTEQISESLAGLEKVQLSHELYLLGECRVERSIPLLEKYIDDARITHHIRHKGMSIGYIAKQSIRKIIEKRN